MNQKYKNNSRYSIGRHTLTPSTEDSLYFYYFVNFIIILPTYFSSSYLYKFNKYCQKTLNLLITIYLN